VSATLPFIVVIDDEPAVCKALERLLRSAGMDVVTFVSGAAFLASLVGGRKPDCVVLDLHMPGLNGFDVQSRLATDPAMRIPLVIITAHDSPEAQERAMAGGASAYLRKPVDRQPLLDAIRNAIGPGT
jgi:FixJ family two-component response regulator